MLVKFMEASAKLSTDEIVGISVWTFSIRIFKAIFNPWQLVTVSPRSRYKSHSKGQTAKTN